jgi:hypothetical protein
MKRKKVVKKQMEHRQRNNFVTDQGSVFESWTGQTEDEKLTIKGHPRL